MIQTWRKRALDILIFSLLGILITLGIKRFFFLLFPLFLSLVVSELIRTSFRRIHPLSPLAKRILIVLILLILFALLSLAAVLITENLIHLISGISQTLSRHSDDIFRFYQTTLDKIESFLSGTLRLPIQNPVHTTLPMIFDDFLENSVAKIPQWIGRIVGFFPRFFLSFFIFLICTYYFSCDWKRISRFLTLLLSEKKREQIGTVKRRFFYGLSQYTKAYLFLFLITFTELFLGLSLLKVPSPLGKALWIALVDILPILGCGTVLVPWALYCFALGRSGLGVALIILYLVIFILRQVLEPKIIGSSIGLHPVLSLLLVIAGLRFFGFFGMIALPLSVTCLAHQFQDRIQDTELDQQIKK